MKDLILLAIHLLTAVARILGPGGARAVVAENLLLRHQLLILSRGRQRAPNLSAVDRFLLGFGSLFLRPGRIQKVGVALRPAMPWCTTPIEAESSLDPDSHHPIISLSGIPSAVMAFRILHPILASTLCAESPLACIAEPTMAL